MDNDIRLSSEKINLLIKLGILDNLLNVTPSAYISATARLPVNKQAEILGIPVICIPNRENNGSPEEQFLKFFKKRVSSYSVCTHEGYLIKSLMSLLIEEFNPRKNTYQYDTNHINEQVSRIKNINDSDIIIRNDTSLQFGGFGVYIDFGVVDNSSIYDKKFFSNRFRNAKIKFTSSVRTDQEKQEERRSILENHDHESAYIKSNLKILELWNSLSKDEWVDVIRSTLMNWDKMHAGWPDISFFSRDLGLTLIEIKGNDSIHASQVFTILKLKEILGNNRIAIGWVNSAKIDYSGDKYKKHTNDSILWMNTRWEQREPLVYDFIK